MSKAGIPDTIFRDIARYVLRRIVRSPVTYVLAFVALTLLCGWRAGA